MKTVQELLAEAKALSERGTALKSIKNIGTSDDKDLGEYMLEREKFLGDSIEYLCDFPAAYEKEFETVNQSIKELKNQLLGFKQPKKELKKVDVQRAFAKAAIYAMYGISAFSTEEAQKEISTVLFPGLFEQKTAMDKVDKFRREMFTKDAIASDLKPGGTYAGYLVNPIYEREMIKFLPEYSDMTGFTRRVPMFAPQHSYPYLSGRTFVATRTASDSTGSAWTTSTAMAAATDGPTFGPRVTIQASTWAAYIPWIDEFSDDIQLNESLEAMMMECFLEAFAEDYDTNVLVADSGVTGQYDGLLSVSGTQSYVASGGTVSSIAPHDLKAAVLKVARTERNGGMWVLHETVLDALQNIRNAVGDYMFWTPPTGEKPGKLGGYPYIEAHVMPEHNELTGGDTFMAFFNPNNLWVGERAGVEVRQFNETLHGLQFGQNFTRWRLRNGFKIVKPAAACLLKLRAN